MKNNWYAITGDSKLKRIEVSEEDDGWDIVEEWGENTNTDILWIFDEASVQTCKPYLEELIAKEKGCMSLNEDGSMSYYPTDMFETAHILANSGEVSNFIFSPSIAESFLETINS